MFSRIVANNVRAFKCADSKEIRKFTLVVGPTGVGKTTLAELLYVSAVSGRAAQFVCDEFLPAESGATLAVVPERADFLRRSPMAFLRARRGLPSPWRGNPAENDERGGLNVDLSDILGDAPWSQFRLLPSTGRFDYDDSLRVSLFGLVDPPAIDPSMIPDCFAEASPPLMERGRKDSVHLFYCWDDVLRGSGATDPSVPANRLATWAVVGKRPLPSATAFIDVAFGHLPDELVRQLIALVPDWRKRVARNAALIVPSLSDATIDVDLSMEKAQLVQARRGKATTTSQLSDGERYAVGVVAALTTLAAQLRGDDEGFVVIEKPEARLDPASVIRLLQFIASVVNDAPIQVVVETNCLEAIAGFTRMLMERSVRNEDGVLLRVVENAGRLQTSWFEKGNLEAWLESGHDPRFISDENDDLVRSCVAFRLAGVERSDD